MSTINRFNFFILLLISMLFLTIEASAQVYSTISGHVFEPSLKQGIQGITVTVVEIGTVNPNVVTATSDKNGLYVLKNLIPGNYTLYVEELRGYYLEPKSIKVPVTKGKNVVNLNLVLMKAGSVSGSVFQADGVTPLVNAAVIAQAPGDYFLAGSTDASGFYRIDGLPETGSAFVSILVPEVGAVIRENVNIISGQDTGNLNFVVLKGINNLSLNGTVRSLSTSMPIVSARLLINGDNSTAVASSDIAGNFKIYGLPTGFYDILIAAEGYETIIKENVNIIQGSPVSLQFQMVMFGAGGAYTWPSSFFSWLGKIALVDEAHAQQSSCGCLSCGQLSANYKDYLGKEAGDACRSEPWRSCDSSAYCNQYFTD